MNIVNVYHAVDAYDYTRPMEHANAYKNLDEEVIKELIENQEAWVKNKTLAAYIISIMDYELGGEITYRTFARTNPPKTKIILNAEAKRSPAPKKALPKDAVNYFWHVGNANGIVAAEPVVAVGGEMPYL